MSVLAVRMLEEGSWLALLCLAARTLEEGSWLALLCLAARTLEEGSCVAECVGCPDAGRGELPGLTVPLQNVKKL